MPILGWVLPHIRNNNPDLATTDLTNMEIGDQGVRTLVEALEGNTTVTHLLLGSNHITDTGAKNLADMLKTNRTITEIELWNNQITNAGAHDLAEALKTNNTVTALNISTNHIGNTGIQALVNIGFHLDITTGGTYKRPATPSPTIGKYTERQKTRNDAREQQRQSALKNGEGI